MPSLSDTLESLSSRTSELAYLTTLNSKPAGPFVQAYLGSGFSSSSSSSSGYKKKDGNVLNLIRDSNESEIRLFKFIGESSSNTNSSTSNNSNVPSSGISGGGGGGGGGGGNKRVEKRENDLITPLKDLRRNQNQNKDEIEVYLKTAMKLVDNYRPMPRARAHITNLLDTHHASQERLIELERLIEEASRPISPSTFKSKSSSPIPGTSSQDQTNDQQQQEQPILTTDEAIKAEEAALKALEASLIPLRKSFQSSNQPTITSESFSPPPPSTRQLPSSPPISTKSTVFQTPAKTPIRNTLQTPATMAREMPHVTNSLVGNGMTPRRIDKFSPLKLITPRAPLGSSGLRNENDDGNDDNGITGGRRSIFGRPSTVNRVTSNTALRQSVLTTPAATLSNYTSTHPPPTGPFTTPYNRMISEENQQTPGPTSGSNLTLAEQQDDTIRLPKPLSNSISSAPVLAPPVPEVSASPHKVSATTVTQETPKAATAITQDENNGKLDGIDLHAEGVKAGIAKIWSTLGDMMHQGFKDGQKINQDVTSSVNHLTRLSNSELPPPPSPSSSSISSLSNPTATSQSIKPITIETIMFSHLILTILRSIPTLPLNLSSNESGSGVDMNELKEHLNSVAKVRNFDNSSGLGTKIIYAAVGKRIIKIDRKGGNVKIKFAD
ncbi:uncharacterized protein L201_005423 [Kwoniella dendrophila CBS 6074]|uniref:Uncharacterized protein n=1 Tax=Kwoniella dendrophila CBS 6074 TaxID=1295534 RepID=A0AAX4JYZ3_9TREE